MHLEPRNAKDYNRVISKYYKDIFKDSKKDGAVLMGVCRGKISEGMDFSDKAARIVIIIGIPFPQVTDPRITLKKDYLDKKNMRMGFLTGKDWYNQQATRAVN